MAKKVSVAVVGATGAVGQAMLDILHQRQFPVDKIYALASARSAGNTVDYGNKSLIVEDLAEFDFSQVQVGLFSPGASISAEYAPKAAAAGCVVIDNTSQFRYDDDIPLVVPEVNPEAIADYTNRGIIANPNCSTIQMLVALKPIYDAVGITRVNVCTYQAVSGSGKPAMDELAKQTADLLNGRSVESKVYPKQIAFNVLPQIDVFMDNGDTKEEWKMKAETKKILDPKIKLTATCVRVPVFVGHAEAVNIECEREIHADEARELLRESPGLMVIDKREDGGYITPVECVGDYATFVSRIREDSTIENGLDFWVVSDNLRKGAALNTVQIAESMINRGLIKK